MFRRLDVTNEQEWMDAVRATISAYGRVDILVNNAGTGARSNVEDTTEEVWDTQMNIHAKGAFLGTKHVIPEMRKMGGGSMINVSSIYGLVGSESSTAYHAANGAIRLFTKSAAIQYAEENIRVNYPSRVCANAADPTRLRKPRIFRGHPIQGAHRKGGNCR